MEMSKDSQKRERKQNQRENGSLEVSPDRGETRKGAMSREGRLPV